MPARVNISGGNLKNNVKSVQTIRTSLSATSLNVTIASVIPSNCIAIVNIRLSTSDLNATADKLLLKAQVINATTLQLTKNTNGIVLAVSVKIVEFENVKSVASGTAVRANSTSDISVTIPSVVAAKSIVVFSCTTSTADNRMAFGMVSDYFAADTLLRFLPEYNTAILNVSYQLIEFN